MTNAQQNNTNQKLEALRKRKEALLSRLNARIAEAERLEDHKQRREDTRIKILVGAAFLFCASDPGIRAEIKAVLQRGITAARDRHFLAERGWL
ncbi:MAG: hypothetical protein ABSD98_01850 [Candidatus Korobacteraceae bacterium]|jgi:hypothetical protein